MTTKVAAVRPELPVPFEWIDAPCGLALHCSAIDAPHLFTTRALPAGEEGWTRLAQSLGATRVVSPKQVHGNATTTVDGPCDAQADAAITASVETAVAVRAADCVPLLLFDPVTNAVGAAHAGWRGTAARMAVKAVEAMSREFGSRPADLIAAVGPSIGPCCYKVGEELLGRFGESGRRWFFHLSDGWRLNLWAANHDQLIDAGLLERNIHVSEICTAMHPDFFPSYRRDGKGAGRLIAAIRPATP